MGPPLGRAISWSPGHKHNERVPNTMQAMQMSYEACQLRRIISVVSVGGGHAMYRAAAEDRFNDLSAREKDVLRLIAKGLTNQEIAQRLFISPHTVKNHVSHIYQKIGMDDRTKVALWAIRTGIVPLDGDDDEDVSTEEQPPL